MAPTLSLLLPREGPHHLLVLGAHPDDAEIGCGATLMRLLDEWPQTTVRWVVFSGEDARAAEARASAATLVGDPTRLEFDIFGHRDGFLPWEGAALKDRFEALKRGQQPDLIFAPRLQDAHQDHRLVAELTWQTYRHVPICEYEIPKYEGDLGEPNLFVAVARELGARKVEHLEHAFPSQRDRQWFTSETFWALLRLRGVECASPTGYAEAFTCRKLLV